MSDELEDLEERVETWMVGQMPIIQVHGGNSVVCKADAESGEVVVESGGACAGCGISNIAAQSIQSNLIMTFGEITDVQVKAPSSDDHGSNTVEDGRGGELQYGDEGPGHF